MFLNEFRALVDENSQERSFTNYYEKFNKEYRFCAMEYKKQEKPRRKKTGRKIKIRKLV